MIRPSTALRTGYAEKIEKKPLVALADSFRVAENGAHGEITESVLLLHGKLDETEIQRLHAESGAPLEPQTVLSAPSGQILERFDRFAAGAATSFLDMTSDNLQLVMGEMPSVRVISQSQSQTPTRILEPFLGAIKDNPEFRDRLAEELKLEDPSVGSVLSGLTSHTEYMLRDDETVQDAAERYETLAKAAYDKGIVNLIAGGNQGALAREFDALGATTSPSAFRSVLVNEYVTVVGAARADGKESDVNSPNASVEVYGLGEQVPVLVQGQSALANGTSVATPLVAGQALDLLKKNPEWTAFQVENELMGRVGYRVGEGESASLGDRSLVGDGSVDPWLKESFGPGLLSGLDDGDMGQFVESKSNVRIGLPGEKEGAFQVVVARTEGEGRNVELITLVGDSQHVVKARYEGGTRVPGSVTEEYYQSKAAAS